MKKYSLIFMTLLSACLIFAGCQTSSGIPKKQAEESSTEKSSVETTTEPIDYQEEILSNYRPANLLDTTMASSAQKDSCILSPASIDIFIGLLYGGADENTKKEIEEYFHSQNFTNNQTKFLQDMKNRDLHIANGIWIQKGINAKSEYQDYLSKYLTRANMQDFSSPKNASDRINTWVQNNTNKLIDSIVDEKDINNTKIFLANALYFNKPWAKIFNSDMISKESFHSPDGEISVDMMHGEADSYFENEHAVAFRKNYQDDFSFVGILPKDETVDNAISLDIPSLLETETSSSDVMVDMPKFKKTLSYDLTDTFLRNGLHGVFNGGLNQMVEKEELIPDEILHIIYIDVNENGTEAEATTSAGFKATSLRAEKTVTLDRPFFFLIQDNSSGEVIFIGYINKI